MKCDFWGLIGKAEEEQYDCLVVGMWGLSYISCEGVKWQSLSAGLCESGKTLKGEFILKREVWMKELARRCSL